MNTRLLASGLTLAAGLNAGALDIPHLNQGADGAFAPTNQNHVVDLSLAADGRWDDPTPDHDHGIYDAEKWAVVFKFSTVNIPAGATVTFRNHPSRAPVVWLVEGEVKIGGKINLSAGGPGGFRGNRGKFVAAEGGGGFGPGGAGYVPGASGSDAGHQRQGGGASPGRQYGGTKIVPLIGGSGGAGEGTGGFGGGYGGGAGGGAILIASSGVLQVTGEIRSDGEAITCGICGHGSGGSVRLIGDTVRTSGQISVDGGRASQGRIRVEGLSLNIGGRFTVEPSHLFPARVIDLWPRDDSPSVFIASVSGQAMPDDPLANIEIGSMADLSLQAVTNEVLVATTYFTTNALVNLRIVARSGRTDAVQTMQYLSSDPVNTNRLFWKANVAFRPGYHVLQAHVLSP